MVNPKFAIITENYMLTYEPENSNSHPFWLQTKDGEGMNMTIEEYEDMLSNHMKENF